MRGLTTASVAGIALAISVSAAALRIDLVPGAPQITLPGTTSLSVVVSGLDDANQIVSSFDVALSYDPVVTATGVLFGGTLGGPADSLSLFALPAGGITLAEVSFLPDAELDALQGDSVTLATLSFTGVSAGISSVAFTSVLLTGRADANDLNCPPPDGPCPALLEPDLGGARITVVPSEVPEPNALALAACALLALRLLRGRRLRSKASR
jgi:hypothetical protein